MGPNRMGNAVRGLLEALGGTTKKERFGSHVVGTDDAGVKELDRKLSFARTGCIWRYVKGALHPVIVYDYTPTRARALVRADGHGTYYVDQAIHPLACDAATSVIGRKLSLWLGLSGSMAAPPQCASASGFGG